METVFHHVQDRHKGKQTDQKYDGDIAHRARNCFYRHQTSRRHLAVTTRIATVDAFTLIITQQSTAYTLSSRSSRSHNSQLIVHIWHLPKLLAQWQTKDEFDVVMQVPKHEARSWNWTRDGKRRTVVPASIWLAESMIVLAISSIELRWTETSVTERSCGVNQTGAIIVTWLEKNTRLCRSVASRTDLICQITSGRDKTADRYGPRVHCLSDSGRTRR